MKLDYLLLKLNMEVRKMTERKKMSCVIGVLLVLALAVTGFTACKQNVGPKTGNNNTTEEPSKDALNEKIEEGQALLDSLTGSDDGGNDVNGDAYWVPKKTKTDLQLALEDAQMIAGKPNASADEVQLALEALTAAINKANEEKKKGNRGETDAGVSCEFIEPADETIVLTEAQSPSWKNSETLRITVEVPFATYEWYVDGTIRQGETGDSITLSARDFAVGTHTVTLKVTTASGAPGTPGAPYTKTLTFTVN